MTFCRVLFLVVPFYVFLLSNKMKVHGACADVSFRCNLDVIVGWERAPSEGTYRWGAGPPRGNAASQLPSDLSAAPPASRAGLRQVGLEGGFRLPEAAEDFLSDGR